MSLISSTTSSRSQIRSTTPDSTQAPESHIDEPEPYVHQGLTIGVDPAKGRWVTPTTPLRDGEVLLIDEPYALVPAMLADEPPFQFCSRHDCNRRFPPQSTKSVGCLRGCIAEVAWCDEECRALDGKRHSMECAWLKQLSAEIRATNGDSDFGLLWLIARILIARHIEQQRRIEIASAKPSSKVVHADDISSSHFGRRGWDAVWNLAGHAGSFSPELVGRWKWFVRTYLPADLLGLDSVDIEEVVDLICKVETNSFGLYPGVTGEYPVTSFVSRGGYYGGGIYPTAAMFNHSCCPNVSLIIAGAATIIASRFRAADM